MRVIRGGCPNLDFLCGPLRISAASALNSLLTQRYAEIRRELLLKLGHYQSAAYFTGANTEGVS